MGSQGKKIQEWKNPDPTDLEAAMRTEAGTYFHPVGTLPKGANRRCECGGGFAGERGDETPEGVIEISEGVNLDTTPEDKIVGIEILEASKK